MARADILKDKAARYHLVAETFLADEAAVCLHEAANVLEQQAEAEERYYPRSTTLRVRRL